MYFLEEIIIDPESLIPALLVFLPIFLYAEIHYRFPLLPSRIFRKQPEIVFDAPYRIETDSLPVLLLIKDANIYPVTLEKVLIRIRFIGDRDYTLVEDFTEDVKINEHFYSKIYRIDVSRFSNHHIEIECTGIISMGKKRITVRNDNYPTLSHDNFETYIDTESLPAQAGWRWGDMHCHTAWTEDQVEFGIPAENIAGMATPMGISFCAATDHSYDLDDLHDSWNRNDPDLIKWSESREIIKRLNRDAYNFTILPGEEVTADNGFAKNVHMVVLNHNEFIPGNNDSLEKLFLKNTSRYYADILDDLNKNSMAYAAHPMTKPPLIQKILIRRGLWNRWDSAHPKLSGYQILNGHRREDFNNGLKLWVNHLLNGSRSYIYSGNDSHGNFNRFRQVKTPILKLHEKEEQIFGEFLTGVKSDSNNDIDILIQDLKRGSVIVSNGPFLNMTLYDNKKNSAEIGKTLIFKPARIELNAISTRFFGSLRSIRIIVGSLLTKGEHIFRKIELLSGIKSKTVEIPADNLPEKGYLRAEITTRENRIALSNPIWFDYV